MRILIWGLMALIAAELRGEEQARPNVLLICVDDLKPVLGCYGDAVAKTPHMDALARRGVRFEFAYCNQAVCSPSRNALMTGLRPQTLGIYDLPTNFRKAVPDAVTVAQYFRSQGYRTEALGKIMHRGHGNGEDEASWTVPHFVPKADLYRDPESTKAGRKDSRGGTRGRATESAEVPDNAYADGVVAEEAVERLKMAAGAPMEPFFLAVGFVRPHLPFVAPTRYWEMHDPQTLPMPEVKGPPEGAPDYALQYGGELRQYSDMPREGEIDAEATRRLIHGYYAATSYVDALIGQVMAALEETGLEKNTIVVLWGDHGWHLGDHSMWCKHTNYEQAARIPLIIATPGGRAGVSRALIETVDLYPTLVELAGLPAKVGLDGVSQAVVVKDPGSEIRDHVIHVYPRNGLLGRAIRTQRHRLVEWKVPGGSVDGAAYEFYDYEEDPLETRNRAINAPPEMERLIKLLATHPEAKPQLGVRTAEQEAKRDAELAKRRVAFQKRDQDGDGRLTLEEFLVKQPDPEEAPARFPRFDADGDGLLSESEYVGD